MINWNSGGLLGAERQCGMKTGHKKTPVPSGAGVFFSMGMRGRHATILVPFLLVKHLRGDSHLRSCSSADFSSAPD